MMTGRPSSNCASVKHPRLTTDFIILNMRKILTLLLAFAATSSVCFSADMDFKVTGKNAPKDGAAVHLIDKLTGSSIGNAVVSKGSFELKGKAEKDAFLAINVDGIQWDFLFFNDGKPVRVDVADSTLTGSALNSKLSECAIKNARAYNEYNRFVDEFMALPGEEQEARIGEFMPEYRARINAYAGFYTGIIEENKDNLIPVAFIEHYRNLIAAADEWNKGKGDKAFNDLFSSDIPTAKHPYALNVKRRIEEADAKRDEANAARRQAEASAQSLVGQKFRDLEEPDTDGKPHKLSEYVGKGKWVLVDFWAAWCNPCKVEMPHVTAAYKKYHDKGFDIVGLSLDREKEDWVRAIREWDMPWIHLSDLKYGQSAAVEVYSVTGIPDNLLIDPNGTIVARGLRGDELEAKLAEIFK